MNKVHHAWDIENAQDNAALMLCVGNVTLNSRWKMGDHFETGRVNPDISGEWPLPKGKTQLK